ncbi:hypothetical protein [Paenibacillus sp. NFR01]|uniref:hypothetical protein n=1 Tax=Paenibacillus sp. NFR01 TaxID=1566279 RepID=UPI0008ADA6A1|nr:hypothetical protein [Paenibacillus sp. NFR01]SES87898.1 hypothetical protein SAMN03159358_0186 [Paenibacillus sp. NFR01]
MPLIHEFLVVSKDDDLLLNKIIRDDNGRIDKKKSGLDYLVEVDDDLIQYFSDTLKWIPNGLKGAHGLNYYGLTEIYSFGASKLKSVIQGWYYLFDNAPSILHLTGNYSWINGEKTGKYEILHFTKEEIIFMLLELIKICEIVENSDDKILLHMGI